MYQEVPEKDTIDLVLISRDYKRRGSEERDINTFSIMFPILCCVGRVYNYFISLPNTTGVGDREKSYITVASPA